MAGNGGRYFEITLILKIIKRYFSKAYIHSVLLLGIIEKQKKININCELLQLTGPVDAGITRVA